MNHRGEDRKIFEEVISLLDKKETNRIPPVHLMVEIGKFFLGAPYAGDTLQTKGTERMVVNLREHDCVTFVENIVALIAAVQCEEISFGAFRRCLRKIRYRDGCLQGYTSRLHYFSDWLYDNQRKGIVRDVTKEIGGRPLGKALNFMTTHLDLYPGLVNVADFERMKSIERAISRRPLFFIPKKQLRHLEDRICEGDLIAITTHRAGLDVQHTGIAARIRKRIHLLHASRLAGRVVLSQETLYRYLKRNSSCSGVMVARVVAKATP